MAIIHGMIKGHFWERRRACDYYESRPGLSRVWCVLNQRWHWVKTGNKKHPACCVIEKDFLYRIPTCSGTPCVLSHSEHDKAPLSAALYPLRSMRPFSIFCYACSLPFSIFRFSPVFGLWECDRWCQNFRHVRILMWR